MKNLLTIIKKELRRFFTDKRMMAALILPGVLVFVLYSLMGDAMANITQDDSHVYKLYVENEPADLITSFEAYFPLELEQVTPESNEAEDITAMLNDKTLDLWVVFDEDWSDKLINEEQPNVHFYFNASSMNSSNLYNAFFDYLTVATRPFTFVPENVSSDNDISMMLMTSLMPFLLITFLYSGSMAVAPESIAGEKERGTIASLLITPVKRRTIAIGKVTALSIVALVSATSSFLGIIFSLPKLAGTNVDINLYTPATYASMFIILLSTILIFIVAISLISAFSKSIKEATGFATPLMIVVMALGVTTMFGTASGNPWLYLIPIYNSLNMLLSLFSGEFNGLPFMITVLSNIIFTVGGVLLLTKMFNSEEIMFRK